MTVKILDERLQPVKRGETGEICIFGGNISRGYLGNPPEQRNFVTLPDGKRMYRSGDLGYELPDGNMVFLRRRDDQVMIRGQRVEPWRWRMCSTPAHAWRRVLSGRFSMTIISTISWLTSCRAKIVI